ncbi:MAG: helix-turn-helix transcriptional regulator [Bermanella sp.]
MTTIFLENPYMNNTTLKNALRALLDTHAWTEETLHEKSGVAQSSINRLLNGTIDNPRLTTLAKIARAFGVHISQLTGGETPKETSIKAISELPEVYGAARETFRLLNEARANGELQEPDFIIINALIKHLSRKSVAT